MSDFKELSEKSSNPDRRKLLRIAAKFSAVMAAVGITNVTLSDLVHAEETGALEELINHAITTGDMDEAIAMYGEKTDLVPEQLDILRSLSESDLQDLQIIREKLQLGDSYQFRTRRG
ncbi:hypothetical protein G5B38_08245 [Pseudohalocynthiibacter aestuariivivens]|nr:hypothetical protein [Pseudohalocynthiibacter aestuariivivens]QIE45510.1 hypothetical protein G5B38_08245 [Pseudohalocynthiibacter aestuariivivens]